jgi:hypothetical protein
MGQMSRFRKVDQAAADDRRFRDIFPNDCDEAYNERSDYTFRTTMTHHPKLARIHPHTRIQWPRILPAL